MSSKTHKPATSTSKKKKNATEVPPNQPKISLFCTKQDGTTTEDATLSRKKRRRRNRLLRPPGLVLEEITLSSDSDGDGVCSDSTRLKRPRKNVGSNQWNIKNSPAKKPSRAVASDTSANIDDVQAIRTAGVSSYPDPEGGSIDDDVKCLENPVVASTSTTAAAALLQPTIGDEFKIPTTVIRKGDISNSDPTKLRVNQESGNLPFYEADTQVIFGGGADPFNDDAGNDTLSNLDMEEIIKYASSSSSKTTPSSSVSPITIGLSSPATSPSLIRKSPVKVSPKNKVTYYSPVRQLRKEPMKRLFTTPTKVSRPSPPSTSDVLRLSPKSPQKGATASPRKQSSQSQFEYLDNFDSVLDEVMSGEFLFNDDDFLMYRKFLCISRPARCLYLKIFQRTLTWYRRQKVIYEKIAQDLSPLFDELHQAGFFSELKDELPQPDLESLLDLLDKEEVKSLAKVMNTKGGPQSSKEICKTELLKMAKTQRTLSKINSCQVITEAVMTRLGGTFRVSEASRDLFSRVFILYSLPQYWDDETQLGANHLLTMLFTKQGKMEYPNYTISKSRNIFRTREDVILFKEGLTLHSSIQATIEAKRWDAVLEVLDNVLEKLKTSVLLCSSLLENDAGLPTFLRAYTAGSILTRAAWLGIEAHQKLKQFAQANERIDFLLNHTSNSYLSHYRGRWHERMIINSKHLKLPLQEMKEIIIVALSDASVLDDHRLGLTARLAKIREEEKKVRERVAAKNKSKKRRRKTDDTSSSDEAEFEDRRESEIDEDKKIKSRNPFFRTYELSNSITERTIEAEQLSLRGDGERVFGKSTFLGGGTSSSNSISSVEDRALSFYRELGYHSGVHAEGSVPISLFGLVFWDVIYMDEVMDVFRGPFQPYPLDLHFNEFYQQRQEKLEEMLHNLRYTWSLTDAYEVMERNWNNNVNKLSIVVWNTFHSLAHAQRLVRSMGLGLLADISERLCRNFRHYRSGFPDLIVWNDTECVFVEVKGPGDKLSPKQSIWLDFLISIGAKAEVCRVKAVSNKRLRLLTRVTEDLV